MAYLVRIAARAERDLVGIYEYIRAGESSAALRWYEGLRQAILTLAEHPNRCPVTPESKQFRHLLYGNKPHVYRVIYRILEKPKRVAIVHIRHGARRRFRVQELL
ncbi:MAG TPA: type II toxin-antitoxin system RelE/ParE family toxin [Candidatus Sulfotelmatobacter sp.]|jgi:plasmid stabilization system protein ParE